MSQLFARIDATALAAQPLAVEQMGPRELGADGGAGQAVDRLAVERSAASPLLSSARTRASIPSSQSVEVTRVRSESHRSAARISAVVAGP